MSRLFTTFVGGKKDILWGIANALAISIPVYVVNMGHPGELTVVAKQAGYAFLVGSHMVRLARYVSLWALEHYYIPNTWAVWTGATAALLSNVFLNTILHTVYGTPDPLTTIVVVALFSSLGLLVVAYIDLNKIQEDNTK